MCLLEPLAHWEQAHCPGRFEDRIEVKDQGPAISRPHHFKRYEEDSIDEERLCCRILGQLELHDAE